MSVFKFHKMFSSIENEDRCSLFKYDKAVQFQANFSCWMQWMTAWNDAKRSLSGKRACVAPVGPLRECAV
jgi:hypothetical protein